MKISIDQFNKDQVQERCRTVLNKMGYNLVDEQCNTNHLHAQKSGSMGQSLQLVFSTYNGVSKLGIFSSNVDEKSGIFSHDLNGESKFVELFEKDQSTSFENGFRLTDEDYLLAIG